MILSVKSGHSANSGLVTRFDSVVFGENNVFAYLVKRDGVERDLSEVLQSQRVFTNVSKELELPKFNF